MNKELTYEYLKGWFFENLENLPKELRVHNFNTLNKESALNRNVAYITFTDLKGSVLGSIGIIDSYYSTKGNKDIKKPQPIVAEFEKLKLIYKELNK